MHARAIVALCPGRIPLVAAHDQFTANWKEPKLTTGTRHILIHMGAIIRSSKQDAMLMVRRIGGKPSSSPKA